MADEDDDSKFRGSEDPNRALQELGEQLDDAWYGPPLWVEFVESPDTARMDEERIVHQDVRIFGPYHFVEIAIGSLFVSGKADDDERFELATMVDDNWKLNDGLEQFERQYGMIRIRTVRPIPHPTGWESAPKG
jgi:hypothetical protein